MTQATEGACAFAWRNYWLIHSDISENDDRRTGLLRYITNLRKSGEYDFECKWRQSLTWKCWINCTTTDAQDLPQIKRWPSA